MKNKQKMYQILSEIADCLNEVNGILDDFANSGLQEAETNADLYALKLVEEAFTLIDEEVDEDEDSF